MVPRFMVERVHLGEASDEEISRVQGDEAAAAQLRMLAAQDEAFLAAQPVDSGVAAICRRAHLLEVRARRRRLAVGGAVLLPALAVAMLALWPAPAEVVGDAPEVLESTRPKGMSPHLVVYRKTATGSEALRSGVAAQQGDVIRVGYAAMGAEHGVIVSVDGRGAVTLHFPERGGSTALKGGGEVMIPAAYRLDDAPDFERFFLVTSEAPIPVDAVLAAAKEGRLESGLPNLSQSSFLLVK